MVYKKRGIQLAYGVQPVNPTPVDSWVGWVVDNETNPVNPVAIYVSFSGETGNTEPFEAPLFIGQTFIKTTEVKAVYISTGINSVSNWFKID